MPFLTPTINPPRDSHYARLSVGWFMLLVTYLLFRSVRDSEMKLLAIAGCDSSFDYEDRLEIIQEKITKRERAILDEAKSDVDAVKTMKMQVSGARPCPRHPCGILTP